MLGRDDETELLESLLQHAAEGHGGGVILQGEPGIGKTALLAYAEERAVGFRVLRAGAGLYLLNFPTTGWFGDKTVAQVEPILSRGLGRFLHPLIR